MKTREGEAQRLIEESVRQGQARFALVETADGVVGLFLGGSILLTPTLGTAIVGMILTPENLHDMIDVCTDLLESRSITAAAHALEKRLRDDEDDHS